MPLRLFGRLSPPSVGGARRRAFRRTRTLVFGTSTRFHLQLMRKEVRCPFLSRPSGPRGDGERDGAGGAGHAQAATLGLSPQLHRRLRPGRS